ncbi:MAG: hypothetical protein KDK90_08970 [Leptospiraceae bacterium]|nr:hypothetical protein [Leptospiraceae bacterium]
MESVYTCFDRGIKLRIFFDRQIVKNYLFSLKKDYKEITNLFMLDNAKSGFYKFTFCGKLSISGVINESNFSLFAIQDSLEENIFFMEKLFPGFTLHYKNSCVTEIRRNNE